MSFMKNLINGTNFDPDGLNALQKVTLRAVVMSFLFFGLVAIEGMIMRLVVTGDVNPLPEMFFTPETLLLKLWTVHPNGWDFGFYISFSICSFMFGFHT